MVSWLSENTGLNGTSEAETAFALGHLAGALEHVSHSTLRIFAGSVIRGTLISALQNEGHSFTEHRFNAWWAGLATLTDDRPRASHSGRAICNAILVELSHSSWQVMAETSTRVRAALLAPRDLDSDAAHRQAHAIIDRARAVVAFQTSPKSRLPFTALTELHSRISRDIHFAPAEQSATTLSVDGRRVAVDGAPSPQWAVEILIGEMMRDMKVLPYALPLPGAVSVAALREPDTGSSSAAHAAALLRILSQWNGNLANAVSLSKFLERPVPGTRITSRAPAVFEMLAGFGPMRSRQIEKAWGISRLGVRNVVGSLNARGILGRTTIAGSHLYSVSIENEALASNGLGAEHIAFSDEAVDEYEASMAALDELLTRNKN